MRVFRLIRQFIRASIQQETAYRANFFINLLHSLLNLAVGVVGLNILYFQVRALNGWDYPAALALMGIYLMVGALRGLFISPSLEALAGLGQEISTGTFDFTLLRPINPQFHITFRTWRIFALLDIVLAAAVIGSALAQPGQSVNMVNLLAFLAALSAAVVVMYALLLAFTSLVFWNPGMLFTWVFDSVFQLARYPVSIYPPWLRVILTWVIPVGIITTIPAQFLTGRGTLGLFILTLGAAAVLLALASWLFRFALKHYTSASS